MQEITAILIKSFTKNEKPQLLFMIFACFLLLKRFYLLPNHIYSLCEYRVFYKTKRNETISL
jgi:hypothetical protein